MKYIHNKTAEEMIYELEKEGIKLDNSQKNIVEAIVNIYGVEKRPYTHDDVYNV